MDKEVVIAAIGVGGTLLGTVLGWFLNNLSNNGKLHIYVCSCRDVFSKGDGFGGNTTAESIDETRDYTFYISLDLYNSSSVTKIMRDIQIVFSDGRHTVWCKTPKDDSTRRVGTHFSMYDKVGPINVPPKAVMKLELHAGIWNSDNEADAILKAKKVYLQYMDEKNRRRKKLIKKEDYANYFSNHKAEEKK